MSNEAQNESSTDSKIILGYFLSVLIPFVGFFFGVYLLGKKLPGHGVAYMGIGLAMLLGWSFLLTGHFAPGNNQENHLKHLLAEDAHQKPDSNLKPAQGAYLWNLGEKVDEKFDVKTNDDFSITHDFGDSGKSDYGFGYHLLTTDRRIAAIVIQSTQGNSADMRKVLSEKYGFRQIRHLTVDDYECYFGTTNRQAILHILQNTAMWLEYRDEELCQIANFEAANRKATVESEKRKQIQGSLQKHL